MPPRIGEVTVSLTYQEAAVMVLLASLGAAYANDDVEYLSEGMQLLDARDDSDALWNSALTKMELATSLITPTGMVS